MHVSTKVRVIEPNIMAVLAAAECSGNLLRLTNPELPRPVYVRVNEVIEACGGKWNRGKKGHVFDGAASDMVEEVLLTGTFSIVKQDFGQFDTPDKLADYVVAAADIKLGMLALEPSCGIGRLVRPMIRAGAAVHAFELDRARLAHLLNESFITLRQGDFLTMPPEPIFNRVVMNPPFAARADIHHITHAFKFLAPGGILVAIASASVRYRDDKLARDFRELVQLSGGTIEDLPDGSFKESGTAVKTVMVRMTKIG